MHIIITKKRSQGKHCFGNNKRERMADGNAIGLLRIFVSAPCDWYGPRATNITVVWIAIFNAANFVLLCVLNRKIELCEFVFASFVAVIYPMRILY